MATTISELFQTAKVAENGCNITEVAPNFYRISTPVPAAAFPPYGFTFNSFLLNDEHPLLVHTGMKQLFPGVRAAVEKVIPVEKLRYIFASHHESDEDGALHEWFGVAPNATLVCSSFAQALHFTDYVNGRRGLTTLDEGQELSLGKHKVRFLHTPHLPHGWETGYLFETTSSTLFSGDILVQLGHDAPALVEDEEKFCKPAGGMLYGIPPGASAGEDPFEMVYMLRNKHTDANFKKLIDLKPNLLLAMHGSSYKGDGARVLQRYAALIQ